MKKALKITGIVLLVLVLLLAVAPFLFQDQIEKSIKKTVNKNVNAQVEWSSLNLSLLSNFPNAKVGLENLSIINNKPFEGDTLFYAKEFELKMGLFEIFDTKNLKVDGIFMDNAVVNIIANRDGIANYDIQKASDTAQDEPSNNSSTEDALNLELSAYQISNSKIIYQDAEAMKLTLEHFNHTGQGDFSKNVFVLKTHTDAKVSFVYDSTAYLSQNNIVLDADLAMDLDQMRFSFKDNKALINQLPLAFDGYVQINDSSQELDINFTTPNSDFKNLLALVPEEYAGNFDGVSTQGEFNLDGRLHGVIDDKHIPKINIVLNSQNAEFQYKDLPKKVGNINLDLKLLNESGLVEDTTIDINTIDFSIDQDRFSGSAHFKNLTKNMKADIVAEGVINLNNLSQAYPVETKLGLNGVLNADFETHFDRNSIENEQYQNIKSKGQLQLTDFKYASEELANPFEIKTALVKFNRGDAELSNFNMTTGQTDIQAQGKLNNLIGYMFSDEDLKGSFKANSNRFRVNDFMTTSAEESSKPTGSESSEESTSQVSTEEAIKIPSQLDLSLDFTAKEVVYENYNLKNATGQLSIKDQKASLNKIQADLFGGKVLVDGNVSTKTETPTFGMSLQLQNIDIASSMQDVGLLKGFTPILKSLVGKFTTEFDFSGDMTEGLSPILTSLKGSGLANIIQARVEPSKMPLTNSLNSQLNVIDFNKLKLNDVATTFKFNNGAVNVKPVKFKIEDIDVNLQGSHSLNNVMDYTVNLNLPAKYFGNEIGSQLAKLSITKVKNMKVDLPIGISGNLKQPTIKVDMQSAVSNLTNQIIEQQKDELIGKAGEELTNLLGGNSKNDKASDSTSTEDDKVEETVKNVLGGLLGGKKKKKENDN
ncbi:AsmA-like C-terminal region-containing protein [Mesohalobacter halotolerans]|uniref:AsmA family protein n=1 Tax=Mesohalobacter halotolerans TaxID=1883405 RepID=A0A4U5TQH2_9FLAO|nr:AsmA-like C-terminal region-containing protein [Mesohalobacter halotolerans]TKS56447.1 AsmA family protein [Mesohalobacter halotolerans]